MSTSSVQRIAVIDMGTNTFNLLIAENKENRVHFLHRDKVGVAFGDQVHQTGEISKDALNRAVDALEHFKIQASGYDCRSIFSVSTAVMRDAKNNAFVIEKIHDQTGIEVELISGEQEAYWIAQAALMDMNLSDDALILDIGGGSVEFIFTRGKEMQRTASFPLGLTRLLHLRDWSDPLNTTDIAMLHTHFEATCGMFLGNNPCPVLVGTAGIFETLVQEINQKITFNVNEELNLPHLFELLNIWMQSSSAEREKREDILPVRRKTLHFGAVFLLWLIERLEVQKILASPYSLAEGLAVDYFTRRQS